MVKVYYINYNFMYYYVKNSLQLFFDNFKENRNNLVKT